MTVEKDKIPNVDLVFLYESIMIKTRMKNVQDRDTKPETIEAKAQLTELQNIGSKGRVREEEEQEGRVGKVERQVREGRKRANDVSHNR